MKQFGISGECLDRRLDAEAGMETCADCGEPIEMGQPSYYRKRPEDDIGQSFHSTCGDPLGIKLIERRADATAAVLQVDNERLRDALHIARGALLVIGTPYAREIADAVVSALEPLDGLPVISIQDGLKMRTGQPTPAHEPTEEQVTAAILEWHKGTWLEGAVNEKDGMRRALRAAFAVKS
jgi:hypothetical protein